MELLGVQYQWYPLQQQAVMPNLTTKPLFTMPTASTQARSTKIWRSQASIRSVLFLINYVLLPRWGLTTSQRYLLTPNNHIFAGPLRPQISRFRAAHATSSLINSLQCKLRSRALEIPCSYGPNFREIHESINLKSVQSAILQNQKPYRLGHLDDAAFKLLRIGLQGALHLLLAVSGMMKQ
ncbi:uncharacterized protein SS50377_28764 [Spironucleus salmonicida]|uniref:Uncharacterized protein n=1 Tax=Spironucleus salmonicida TaxID=348837 RepID=A0A9P8RUC7_9EUKA|nr:hypothetical protein SS50377_28764 [Spironucleus salmonicida]